MDQVRYLIIGCGAIGQRRHIPECAANPRSKVAALVDVNEARVKELAAQYHAKAHTDAAKALKQPDIDAVVVCGPNQLHASQSIDALNAGKHVLVEKPMAATRDEAKAMIAAARKNKKFLMVGQNQRLMPAHQKAKKVLDSGVLGKVLAFRTSFKHPGPEGWSVDAARSWFFQKDAAVMGVCGDLGVHKADLMRWLLGQEFTEVQAIVETRDKKGPDGKLIPLDDNALLLLKTRSGIIGSVEVSWTNYGGEDNMTVLYCQKGTLSLGTDRTYGVIVDYRNGERELHKVGEMASNVKQVASGVIDMFTDCILRNRKPPIDGREGYQSLNVILTAMEAARARHALPIR